MDKSTIQFLLNQITLNNLLRLGGFGIFGWFVIGIYKLNKKEKEIFDLKSQIDNIEHDETSTRLIRSGYIRQSVFEKMTDKRKRPMDAKLETLKMERQFLLDKIPLLGLFKK